MLSMITFERAATFTFDLPVKVGSTNLLYTGLAKADFNISKDGAAFAALNASSTVTEIGTTGVYVIVLHASTDATCDRFVIRCTQATASQDSVIVGRSQHSMSKLRINSAVNDVAGSGIANDAPLYIGNTTATGGNAAVKIAYATSGGNNQSSGILIQSAAGWGAGIFVSNSATGIELSCLRGIQQDWGTTMFYIAGSPGAAGGKFCQWATLGGTAPTGPIIDLGPSMTVAQLIDWTSTPASSKPVARIIAGGAGAALELRNSSTGQALLVNNTGTGDAGKFVAAGSAGYALNLDQTTADTFGMRIDGPWPETTGSVASLDFFGAMGRILGDQLGLHTLNKTTQVATTYKRDGVTTLQSRAVADDGTTQTVGAVS